MEAAPMVARTLGSGATFVCWALTALSAQAAEPNPQAAPPKPRTFVFTYGATVTGLREGQTARVWLPVPPTNEDQEVRMVARTLPAPGQDAREEKFGNRLLYVEAKAGPDGKLPLEVVYHVTRREVRGDPHKASAETYEAVQYLQPDKRVPVDGKPLELIKGKSLPGDQV